MCPCVCQFLSYTISTPSVSSPLQLFHFLPKVEIFSFTGLSTMSLYLQLSFSLPSQYPSIPCCLPIHTFLFSPIHQHLPIFQPLFSKTFYFFLPSNSHKRRPNPHRSPPMRTNVVRIHHSEHSFIFHNHTEQRWGDQGWCPHAAVTARLSSPSLHT